MTTPLAELSYPSGFDIYSFLNTLEIYDLGNGVCLDSLAENGYPVPELKTLEALHEIGYIRLCRSDEVERGNYKAVIPKKNLKLNDIVVLINPFIAATIHQEKTQGEKDFIVHRNDLLGHHPAIFLNDSYRRLWLIPDLPPIIPGEDISDYYDRVANFLNDMFLKSR